MSEHQQAHRTYPSTAVANCFLALAKEDNIPLTTLKIQKLIYFANGEHKTAHYAICTAFMALGMMIPGMAAGWLQEVMGYQMFFIWIMICTLATFGVTAMLKIDPEFGKK